MRLKYLAGLLVLLAVILSGCTGTQTTPTVQTPTPTPTPTELNDAVVKLILGDKIDGYAYEVEVVTLCELSDAPGKRTCTSHILMCFTTGC